MKSVFVGVPYMTALSHLPRARIARHIVMAFVLCAISTISFQALAQATIPDSRVGRVLAEQLAARNSGDWDRVHDFVRQYEPGENIDKYDQYIRSSGGSDLLKIIDGNENRIQYVVQERGQIWKAIGVLQIDAQTGLIARNTLARFPPEDEPVGYFISANRQRGLVSDILDDAIQLLNERYVYEEEAKQMERILRERHRAGEFDDILDGFMLAGAITNVLREVTDDRHLALNFYPAGPPAMSGNAVRDSEGQGAVEQGPRTRRAGGGRASSGVDCGIRQAQMLPDEIGYVKLDRFPELGQCKRSIDDAFRAIDGASSIVLDLRENPGGSPEGVSYIAAYFLSEPTLLNSQYNRYEDSTTELWSSDQVDGTKLTEQSVYVLTSQGTFSAAEAFTYALQMLNRVTVVGENSGGGAHPTRTHRLDQRFSLRLPEARVINPISGGDWEGVGVSPDIAASSAQALDVAISKISGGNVPQVD